MKRWIFIGILVWSCIVQAVSVYASEEQSVLEDYLEDTDFKELDKAMSDLNLETGSFSDLVSGIMEAEGADLISEALQTAGSQIASMVSTQKSQIGTVVAMAVISAVFTNFSFVFCNNGMGDTGFYVIYLMLISVLIAVFRPMAAMAETLLTDLLQFMQVLLPSYFMAMGSAGQTGCAVAFYELAMVLITIVQWIYVKILLPLTWLYFILRLVNGITKEEMLSGFADLLFTLIQWVIRITVGLVVGLHIVQGMILPSVDTFKNTSFGKTISSFPGVGNMSTMGQLLLGAGCIVKNGIGTAALIVLVVLAALPFLKLGLFTILYQFAAAMIQPVTDARIIQCMRAMTDSMKILMRVLGGAVAMFFITIALTCLMTNMGVS